MSDQNYYIGEAAGKIYQALEQSGTASTSSLQKSAKISDAALYNQALGWLAREGKVSFAKKGKSIEISLAHSGACC